MLWLISLPTAFSVLIGLSDTKAFQKQPETLNKKEIIEIKSYQNCISLYGPNLDLLSAICA